MVSFSGLSSGIDTESMITALMQIEKNNQVLVQNRKAQATAQVDAYSAINTRIAVLQGAAEALRNPSNWNALTATSSNTGAVIATATSGALSGALSFTVDRLASAQIVRGSGTVASLGSIVATGNILVAGSAGKLGFSGLSASAGVALGDLSVKVTQSSAAASKTGATLAASTVITAGVNDTLDVNINGTPATITIAAGTYTRDSLAAAVTSASGGALHARVDGSNRLVLSTTREGSAATLQVTGGSALTDLALSVDGAAHVGTNGVVEIGGVSTVVTNTDVGSTQVLGAPGGTVTATFGSGLRAGEATAKNISVGSGTLSDVVNAINSANAGVTASAVKVGENQYRLQVSSKTTGEAGRFSIDPSVFAAFGGPVALDAGNDALLTVGEGTGAYQIASSSNTVSDVLSGVTLELKSTSTTPVTVSVSADVAGLTEKVQKLVEAANGVLNEIKTRTAYNVTEKQGSSLTGDATVRRIQNAVVEALTGSIASSTLGSVGLVGVSFSKEGVFTFDKTKFADKYAEDPVAVAGLFQAGGTSTDTRVSFISAPTKTVAGTYAINITTAAQRAERLGNNLSGAGNTITAAETIDVRVGSTTISYAASAGESLESIATGLNEALGSNGLGVAATVESGRLVLRTLQYGASAGFEVRTSATGGGQTGIGTGTFQAYNGVDVAGTIGGKAATGSGQILTVDGSDTELGYVALRIDGTTTGAYGTFSFAPGVAQRLAKVVFDATDTVTGTLVTAKAGANSRIEQLNKLNDQWTERLAAREARLRAQFATMETMLGSLKNQGSWLSSQLASLG